MSRDESYTSPAERGSGLEFRSAEARAQHYRDKARELVTRSYTPHVGTDDRLQEAQVWATLAVEARLQSLEDSVDLIPGAVS